MRRQEIPSEQWGTFARDFSRDHAGEPVTIEVLMPDLGPQHLADNLPLQGLSFDTAGTRPSSLEISAGESPDHHVRHVVDRPLSIQLARDDQNHDIALQIEPADGPKTLILLHGAGGASA